MEEYGDFSKIKNKIPTRFSEFYFYVTENKQTNKQKRNLTTS